MTLREFIMFLIDEATTERLDAKVFFEVEGEVRSVRRSKAVEMISPDELVLHSYTQAELDETEMKTDLTEV